MPFLSCVPTRGVSIIELPTHVLHVLSSCLLSGGTVNRTAWRATTTTFPFCTECYRMLLLWNRRNKSYFSPSPPHSLSPSPSFPLPLSSPSSLPSPNPSVPTFPPTFFTWSETWVTVRKGPWSMLIRKMPKCHRLVVVGGCSVGKTALIEQAALGNHTPGKVWLLFFVWSAECSPGREISWDKSRQTHLRVLCTSWLQPTCRTVEDIYDVLIETERGAKEKVRIYDTAGLVSKKSLHRYFCHNGTCIMFVLSPSFHAWSCNVSRIICISCSFKVIVIDIFFCC